MPQFFSEYLFPKNLIALGILTFLTTFFFYWLIELIRYWRWLRTEQKQIENKQNVQPLVTARQERDRGREDNDQKTNPENTFSKFCAEGSLDRGSPIAKHLNAIFLAGWDESRLEVGELINHTTSELFKRNSLFRSVLAVFIVIGLFGTLFGLADSLTGLFPALKANVASETPAANSEGMIQALGILLEGMKGALAPSICGIFFTILGVILYGAYLQFACHPIKAVLERLTLTVWVPQLYPTTSQKLAQTLQQSESHMQEGFRTAAQFSESVQKVHSNIDEFNESLAQASAITEPLSDSVKQINKAASDISTATDVLNTGFAENLDKFSEKFSSSVTHLTGFQDEIRELHQQFQRAANQKLNQFQETANQKLDQQIEKSNEHNQNLAQLSNVLTRVPEALKSYETTYINSLEQIDEKLQKFINKATETNTSIYTENREWFEKMTSDNHQQISAMQKHLEGNLQTFKQNLVNELKNVTSGLAENLGDFQETLDSRLVVLNERLENFDTPLKEAVDQVKETFDKHLDILNKRLESFDAPLKEASEKMRGTYADSVRYTQNIVGDLKKEIQEQNAKYEEQLTGVKNLNNSVKGLLTQLDESSKNQKEAVNTLSTNVGGLTTDIQSLDAAIKSFTSDSGDISQSIGAIKGHVETLGNASRELVQKADVTPLNANIKGMNRIIGEISQNSQTLADAVNILTQQINSSGSKPPPKRSFFTFFSKLNPFSRRKIDGR